MALSQDAKNYGNRPRLRGKHMRSGPLADIIREVSSPLQTLEFHITHADMTAASNDQVFALPALPTGAELIKVMCLSVTNFDGGDTDAGTMSLGVTADPDKYGRALSVHADNSPIDNTRKVWTVDDDKGADEVDAEGASTSGLALEIKYTGGGAHVSNLTQGEFKVCILYAIMPL